MAFQEDKPKPLEKHMNMTVYQVDILRTLTVGSPSRPDTVKTVMD